MIHNLLSICFFSLQIGERLKITWNDDHTSDFDLGWLKARSFNSEDREKYLRQIYRPPPRLWSKSEFNDCIESFDFDDIFRTKEGANMFFNFISRKQFAHSLSAGLRSWLYSLSVNGCAFIRNAPAAEDSCRRIADLVGFIKKTHYGEEFIVQAKEGTSNVAYLSAPLQIHTDLPYYEYKPGINLLHCLVQSNSLGAFNLLVDGFHVACRLKNEYPDFYRILTTTLVNWSDYGNEDGHVFRKVYRAPVIRQAFCSSQFCAKAFIVSQFLM